MSVQGTCSPLLVACWLLLPTAAWPATAPPNVLFPIPLVPELGPTQRGVALGDLNGDGRIDLILGIPARQAAFPLLGNGDGSFRSSPAALVAGWPCDLRLADLNRDGHPDLISANDLTSTLSIAPGGTNGTFGPPQLYRLGAAPHSIAIADFNGDGRLDVAVALFGQPDVAVLLGSGTNGSFGATNRFSTGSEAWSIAAGDLDGNGTVDLVVAGDYDYNLRILAGRGNGLFNLTNRLTLAAGIRFVTLGDFNGDQKPDLLALSYDGQAVVLTNEGANRFTVSARLTLAPQLHSAVTGDFNRDGRTDFVCTDGKLSAMVVRGNGDGTFGSPLLYWAGPGAGRIAAADVNGDGNLDLITANDDSTAPGILIGSGNGSFRSLRNFPAAPHPTAAVLLDLNRDGLPDVASLGWDGNRSRAATLAIDLGTGDGRLSRSVAYSLPPGSTALAAADLNRDGRMDLVVGNSLTNQISRWLGSGSGSFSNLPPLTLALSNCLALAIGPLNADTFPDLAVISGGQSRVELRLNDGQGSFGPALLLQAGADPQDVAISLPDRNSRVWVATANRGDQTATVFRGPGDGTFAAGFPLPLPSAGQRVLFGDFDRDGNTDLAVAGGRLSFDSTVITFFWGNGNGGWTVDETNYVTGLGAGILSTADFNGDGLPDLAVGNRGTATLAFLLGTAGRKFTAGRTLAMGPLAAALAGDLDNDGRPDLALLNADSDSVTALLNASIPMVQLSLLPSERAVRITWPAWRGWALETSPQFPTLPAWTVIASNTLASESPRSLTNSLRSGASLFRLGFH